jgi:hypothetical protein
VSFVQDLGVNLDSLGVTTASVATDVGVPEGYCSGCSPTGAPGPLNAGPITVASGLISGGVDSALSAWETTNGASAGTEGNFYYGIIAAYAGGSTAAGNSRFAATFTSTNGATLFSGGPENTAINTAATDTTAFFADVNAATSYYDAPSGPGAQALTGFGMTSTVDGTGLGGTSYMYEVASVGGSGSHKDYIYTSSNAITVGLGGAISGLQGPTIPLPAAFWLLGSGVLGLLGIGRRRSAPLAG